MDAELTTHIEQLRTLYISLNLTVDEVMAYMIQHHQLSAERVVYVRLFKKWGFRKNKRAHDWEFIDRSIKRRKNEGKESEVFHNGLLIPKQRVEKEIARNVTTLQQMNYATAPSPSPPDGFSVVTPPPSSLDLVASASACDILIIETDEAPQFQSVTHSFKEFLVVSQHVDTSQIEFSLEEATTCELLCDVIRRCVSCVEWVTTKTPAYSQYLGNCTKMTASLIVVAARSSGVSISFPPGLSDYKLVIDILAWALCSESPISLKLLEDGVAYWAYKDVFNVALFIAVTFGRITTVSCLISAGLNVDPVDRDGFTPLHVAAERNHPEIVDLLLSNGAQLGQLCKRCQTVWPKIWLLSTHDEVARILVKHGAVPDFHSTELENILHELVSKGDIKSVTVALGHGMNSSIESSSGVCLLREAIVNCHLEMVILLVEAGANTACITVSDFPTPLEVLASYGTRSHSRVEAKMRIYEYLVGCGALPKQELPVEEKGLDEILVKSVKTTDDIRQSFESLSVNASQLENIYAGSGPPRHSYMGNHLSMAPSPALSQISLSIGSLFGNGRSLPPPTKLPSPVSSLRNRVSRLPKHQSLKMPHPQW